MKRVTLTVADAYKVREDGDDYVKMDILESAQYSGGTIYVAADDVESIEDVREPLPTEPGVRFWGIAPGFGEQYAAQWWFVRQNGAGVIFYAPTRTDQLGIGVSAADVERVGLVRLPDPEATP